MLLEIIGYLQIDKAKDLKDVMDLNQSLGFVLVNLLKDLLVGAIKGWFMVEVVKDLIE